MLDIYIALIPDDIVISDVYPKLRNDEIAGVKNETVKIEKYCVWRLLSSAVQSSLGRSIETFEFDKLPSGKWVSNSFYFSLSHSSGTVAVIISDKPVGIDIQEVKKANESLAKRIMTDEEFSSFSVQDLNQKDTYFTELWAKKEAIYKYGGHEYFTPSSSDTFNSGAVSFEYTANENKYVIAYKSDSTESPKISYVDI